MPNEKRRQLRTMKQRKQMLGFLVLAACLLALLAALSYYFAPSESSQAVTVNVFPATLSQEGEIGEAVFKANCAACHGENAAGTNLGPPLIHDIYNPSHHSDQAFYLAAAGGVRQHHWLYGDMPPQPQVSQEEVTMIIRYIRELQAANGIIK